MTPPEKLLVALDRAKVEALTDYEGAMSLEVVFQARREIEAELRAALDRDPDELIDRVAEALYTAPWTEMGGFPEVVWGRLGKHEREPHLLAARAVIAAIEGEGDE